MTGFEVVKNKQQTEKENILQPVAIYLVLLAVFVAYSSVFKLGNVDNVTIGIMPVFVVLAIYFLQRIKWNKNSLIVSLISIIIIVILGWSYITNSLLPMLNSGFGLLVESFVDLYNAYYGAELSVAYALSKAKGNEIIVAMFIVQFVLAMILNIVIRKKRGVLIAIVIGVLPAILAACVGYMPSVTATWMSIIAIVFYVQCYKFTEDEGAAKEIKVVSGILLILFTGSLVFSPMIESYITENNEKYKLVRTKITELQKLELPGLLNADIDAPIEIKGIVNYSKGGIGKGDFANLSRYQPDGVVEMEITVSEMPKEDIYLRAFTAADYTSDGWKEMDEESFQAISAEMVVNARDSFLSQPAKRIADGVGYSEMEHIRIELKSASKEFGYAPYYALLPDNYYVIMDGYVDGDGRNQFEYDYFPRHIADEVGVENWGECDYSWYEYQDFVWWQYLNYPSELNMLEEKCASIDSMSVETMADDIDEYFRSSLTYFVAPGACPAGEDFVEYFLFENKRGFCVHFASAATLMYRINGFPARYVEGYVIEAKHFEEQSDGTYKAKVTDSMAHAWCETFDNEKGWQLREHTLGYTEEGSVENSNTNEFNNATTQSTENVESTSVSEETTIGSNTEQEQTTRNADIIDSSKPSLGGMKGNGNGNIIKRVIVIVAIIIIFTCCLLQRKIRRKSKVNKFRILSNNEGIKNIYTAVYEICVFQGVSKNQKSDKDMIAEMKADFPQLKPEEWEWMYKCVERATFTPYKIQKEENRKMYKLYQRFRYEIIRDLPLLKKIWFLYIRAM